MDEQIYLEDVNNRIVITKELIEQKYKGQWGVFSHDMYKHSEEEYAAGFVAAFDTHKEALQNSLLHGENSSIHIIQHRK